MAKEKLSSATVTISEEEYKSLLSDSNFLLCLQGAGVDNWEGYDYAKEDYAEQFGDEDDDD
jgi:hypothetical protein